MPSQTPTLQRLIVHKDYSRLSDSLTALRDQHEVEETVTALQQTTGQQSDLYTGRKPVDHAPQDNYVIGHGTEGMALDYGVDEIDLPARGIQTGDTVRLITCHAGTPGGTANECVAHLGAAGIGGVRIVAPTGFVNWNKNGPVVVTVYLRDEAANTHRKKYEKKEDAAWDNYVVDLKRAVIQQWEGLPQTQSPDVARLLEVFVDKCDKKVCC